MELWRCLCTCQCSILVDLMLFLCPKKLMKLRQLELGVDVATGSGRARFSLGVQSSCFRNSKMADNNFKNFSIALLLHPKHPPPGGGGTIALQKYESFL